MSLLRQERRYRVFADFERVAGDAEKCKAASDLLLNEHGVYIQPNPRPLKSAD